MFVFLEYGGPEGSDYRATSMTGGEAMMGMDEQEGMKRQMSRQKGRKTYVKAVKRKTVSHQRKGHVKRKRG